MGPWIEALEMIFRMRDIAVLRISARVGKVRRCSHTFEITLEIVDDEKYCGGVI